MNMKPIQAYEADDGTLHKTLGGVVDSQRMYKNRLRKLKYFSFVKGELKQAILHLKASKHLMKKVISGNIVTVSHAYMQSELRTKHIICRRLDDRVKLIRHQYKAGVNDIL